jgi:hypothetical protein
MAKSRTSQGCGFQDVWPTGGHRWVFPKKEWMPGKRARSLCNHLTLKCREMWLAKAMPNNSLWPSSESFQTTLSCDFFQEQLRPHIAPSPLVSGGWRTTQITSPPWPYSKVRHGQFWTRFLFTWKLFQVVSVTSSTEYYLCDFGQIMEPLPLNLKCGWWREHFISLSVIVRTGSNDVCKVQCLYSGAQHLCHYDNSRAHTRHLWQSSHRQRSNKGSPLPWCSAFLQLRRGPLLAYLWSPSHFFFLHGQCSLLLFSKFIV